MARKYDITKRGDIQRMFRDIERDVKAAAKQSMRGAQHSARVRCPVHGQYTQVRETASQGGFEITGCCDVAIKKAYEAAGRRFSR